MKPILFALFVGLLLVGCGEEKVLNNKTAENGPSCEACADCWATDLETPSKVTEIFNEAQEKAPTNVPNREVLIDELEKREGAWYAKGEAEPFTGTEVGYYEDGSKSWEVPVVDGKTQGTRIEYYKDGRKKREIPWVDGKRHGLQTSWYEDGQKKEEENYKEGKLQGVRRGWYDNGSRRVEANYKDGMQDGVLNAWYNNSLIKEKSTYSNGKLVSAFVFKPHGEKCPETSVKNGNGVKLWYVLGSTQVTRETYKDGERVRD